MDQGSAGVKREGREKVDILKMEWIGDAYGFVLL